MASILRHRLAAAAATLALLSGCGGDDGGGGSQTASTPTPIASPTPATAACTLADREAFVRARLDEWYLFPELLPASLDPAGYATVDAYLDALTATARAQGKDRHFTYLTSIRAEEAYYTSGTSAGFGVRLSYDQAANRVFVSEAFEGAPALATGIDRGTELLAIGENASALTDVSALMASGGPQAVSDALGPSTVRTTRVLRVADAAGPRTLTLAKAEYELDPVSSRYGVKVLSDAGGRYGYVNLRTFIDPAEPQLLDAFATLRAAGITRVVVDLRYNGGGLVSVAELLANLLGGNRTSSDVIYRATYRPSKSSENTTAFFAPQPQSVSPMRVAFIGTGGTASASELVINAFVPYLRANAALVGSNTFGKPVGQIPLDNAACDDRLRVMAFALRNANGVGDYFDGLAPRMQATCQAGDDLTHPMGDPAEASTRTALDFLEGKSCTPIGGVAAAAARSLRTAGARALLTPARPTPAQRETPGLF
jgi:carboxyl-terminal processing protease